MIFLAWNFLIFWPAVCTEKQANVRSAKISAHCIMKIAKHHIHVTFPTFSFRPPLRWSKHIATMQAIFLCFYFWFLNFALKVHLHSEQNRLQNTAKKFFLTNFSSVLNFLSVNLIISEILTFVASFILYSKKNLWK